MQYLGIDIGGTKISIGIFTADGQMVDSDSTLIEGRTGTDVGALVLSFCDKVLSDNNIASDSELSIGVCIPGITYSKTGCVWAPNIPGWDNYPLYHELKGHYPQAVVTIESDRTCYILGEINMGGAKGCENAVFIAVGTGIGAGILVDGKILHGHSDIIGAIGWLALKPPYDKYWDQCGCFETHASGDGIAKQAHLFLQQDKGYSGELRNIPLEEVTSHHVFAAYDHGDPLATRVIDQAVEMWGMAAANLVSIFNPEMVIFGGGVFGPAASLIDRIYAEALKWAQPISIKQCKFVATQLPKMAGLYGAGGVAIQAMK